MILGGGWCECCSTEVGSVTGKLDGGGGDGWLRESKRNKD